MINENDMVCDSYEYDIDADAVSITQYNYNDYTYSVEASNELILDFDSRNNIIGIELLSASEVLEMNKKCLNNVSAVIARIISDGDFCNVKFSWKVALWKESIYKCSL